MRDRVLDTGSSADKNEVYVNRCALETRDIILRKAEFDDWEPMYRNVWSRAETAKYMAWRVTDSEEAARERIQKTIAYQRTHDAWVVCEKMGGEPVGFAGVEEVQAHVFEDTGIAVGPEYVGRGYGKQILSALLEYCGSLGGKTFLYSTRKDNAASRALALSCGFIYRGSRQKADPKSGRPYELEVYSKKLPSPASCV